VGKVDLGGKRTINIYNQAWLQWTLQGEAVTVESEVSAEFQFVARATDSLLRAQGPAGPFLTLTELQFHYDPEMPARLAAYAALARQKYKLDVFVTVVNLLPPPASVTPERALHRDFMGQMAHQDFQVIALWELDAGQIVAWDNPALLPFVPLMQGGNTKEMVVACAERIRQEPEGLELETILAMFASYVLDTKLIKQLLRWEMTIIQESPIIQELYQLAFAKGEQQGRQEGRQEGREEGERQATLKGLYQILTIRFDTPSADWERRLEPLALPALQQLTTAALTLPTLSAFEQTLAEARLRYGFSAEGSTTQ
jgi:predicted transposase YdaD